MDSLRIRHTWRERAFVFGGIAVAGATSGIGVPLGAGEDILAPVWLAAIGWTVLATVAHALWRGFRLGDWSADREYEPPGVNHDAGDCATCTGAYYYRRTIEPRFSYWPGNPH